MPTDPRRDGVPATVSIMGTNSMIPIDYSLSLLVGLHVVIPATLCPQIEPHYEFFEKENILIKLSIQVTEHFFHSLFFLPREYIS